MENEGNSAALVDAYTRALGRRFLFRLPYIGPPAQEIRRDAYGYVQRDKGLGRCVPAAYGIAP